MEVWNGDKSSAMGMTVPVMKVGNSHRQSERSLTVGNEVERKAKCCNGKVTRQIRKK